VRGCWAWGVLPRGCSRVITGSTNQQYLVFRNITKDDLSRIDRQRASIGKHTRMTHYTDTDLLVIKLMPSAKHETAYISLASRVNHKLKGMGLPIESLYGMGGTRYVGSNSSKEGDSAYKPICRPREVEWPTLVFEAGLSESLRRLRTDAHWWLVNSAGDVKIVMVISIIPARKSLQIEQWCMPPPTGPSSATRARSNTNANANDIILVPTKIQELTVIQDPPVPPLQGTIPTYTVTGAPLTLEFEKLLLRVPVLPEGKVIFTAADLQAWAERYWFMVS
jgi:hypothetical protein